MALVIKDLPNAALKINFSCRLSSEQAVYRRWHKSKWKQCFDNPAHYLDDQAQPNRSWTQACQPKLE